MRVVGRFWVIGLTTAALAACSSSPRPTDYANPGWGFAVTFQAKPKVTEHKASPHDAAPASILVEANAAGEDFSVNVLDASRATATPDQLLANAPNVVAQAMGIDVGSVTDTTVGDISGRQVVFDKNDKPVMMMRVFDINGRLYEVSATLAKGIADPQAKAFLDSFHLIAASAPTGAPATPTAGTSTPAPASAANP